MRMGACGSEEAQDGAAANVELPQQRQSAPEDLDEKTTNLLVDHYKKRIEVLQQRCERLESECERQRKRASEAELQAKRATTVCFPFFTGGFLCFCFFFCPVCDSCSRIGRS